MKHIVRIRRQTGQPTHWHGFSKVLLLAIAFALTASGNLRGQEAAATPPLRNVVECSPRSGLPNFFSKLRAGKPVKVAYLGGSITAQRGWRVLSLKWLQERFPSAQLEEINAGIGGTGSDIGVFRLEDDVLRFHPDLMFVEFAVNDEGISPDRTRKAVEGIVRHTWRMYPSCDICFVYTIIADHLPELREGKMSRSASVMEEIADYYKIPSIHFGSAVAALDKAGKLVFSSPEARVEQIAGDELNQTAQLPMDSRGRIVFSKDGVHPYTDTGHVIYTQALIRALTEIAPVGTPGIHKPDVPIDPNNWEQARVIRVDKAAEIQRSPTEVSPGALTRQFAKSLPALTKLQPGDSLRFRFRGTAAFIYGLRGPDCGMVEVTLDGVTTKVVNFDKYCGFHRLSTLPIGENLKDGEHDVTMKVLSDPIAKGEILAGKGLADWKSNPEKFQGLNWYLGAIFLLGHALPK